MIQIRNYFIPFIGYKCMTVWPFMFVRKLEGIDGIVNQVDLTHEGIHGEQQKEMLVVGAAIAAGLWFAGCGWWSLAALPVFFVWYVAEWAIRLFAYGNQREGYRNISFEQEAFMFEHQPEYLAQRKRFAWLKYITQKTYRRK